ncbi:hypothetical protein K492DRAFT_189536 [Lichtheimia hyalospora FSU 10163]|nr:hypothetical protein K492DRAFT_189536 [Lichtheimia hyalospora FSU 10163]
MLENHFVSSQLRKFKKSVKKSKDDVVNKHFWKHVKSQLAIMEEKDNKRVSGNEVMKPGYRASIRSVQRVIYLLTSEIKLLINYSKENTGDDKVKLGNEMKFMLQSSQRLKVHDPKSYGLLVQGQTCSVFLTDAIYKPMYRIIDMSIFQLITKIQNLPLLPHAVEFLLACQIMVYRVEADVEERYAQKR